MIKDDHIVTKIRNDGVVSINNIIKKEDLEIYKKITDKGKAVNKIQCLVIPTSKISLGIKILKLQFKKIFEYYKFKNLSKNLDLQNDADLIFGGKSKLIYIDLYKSGKSTDSIIDWHCDQAYSGRSKEQSTDNLHLNTHPHEGVLKFFFCLTDVDSNNGCLGYIPKSHLITYYLKICFYKKELKYEPFWKLTDMRKLLTKNYVREKLAKYLKNEVISEFMKDSSFVENGNKDTNKYDIKVNAGGAVLFNELGFHRGSSPSKEDRYALRFFYQKNNGSKFFFENKVN